MNIQYNIAVILRKYHIEALITSHLHTYYTYYSLKFGIHKVFFIYLVY